MTRLGSVGKISLLMCLAFAAPANAAEYVSATAGGTGGKSFGNRCQPDQVLVGVTGFAASLIDRIDVICAQVDRGGHWVSAPANVRPAGATSFELRCPRNYAVSGIVGHASLLVDRLRIYCGPLGAESALVSVGNLHSGAAGGTGGSPFGPFHCADGKPGSGIGGRAGVYLDQIYLVCNTPQPFRLIQGRFEPAPGLTSVGRTDERFHIKSSVPAAGNVQVAVRSANPAIAAAPSSVTFGSGTFGGLAGIRGVAPGCTTITASFQGDEYSGTIMVDGASTSALSLTLNRRVSQGVGPMVATLTLPAPAPAAGTSITLGSSDPKALRVPSSVEIVAGSRSTTFDIPNANLTGAELCVVLTATGNGGAEQRAVMLTPTSIVPRIPVAPLPRIGG